MHCALSSIFCEKDRLCRGREEAISARQRSRRRGSRRRRKSCIGTVGTALSAAVFIRRCRGIFLALFALIGMRCAKEQRIIFFDCERPSAVGARLLARHLVNCGVGVRQHMRCAEGHCCPHLRGSAVDAGRVNAVEACCEAACGEGGKRGGGGSSRGRDHSNSALLSFIEIASSSFLAACLPFAARRQRGDSGSSASFAALLLGRRVKRRGVASIDIRSAEVHVVPLRHVATEGARRADEQPLPQRRNDAAGNEEIVGAIRADRHVIGVERRRVALCRFEDCRG